METLNSPAFHLERSRRRREIGSSRTLLGIERLVAKSQITVGEATQLRLLRFLYVMYRKA